MAQNYTWPSVSVTAANPSVAPNGQSPSATSSTLVAGQDPSGDQQALQTDASGRLLVDIASASGSPIDVDVVASVLPTGAATSALQTTGNASLASIDSKLTAPLSVTGPLTDAQLRAAAVPVSAASLPLPTGAATSANQATVLTRLSGSLVPAAFDEVVLTYTGDNITTAEYKLATVTVKTLTLSYTGDRLDSVVAV